MLAPCPPELRERFLQRRNAIRLYIEGIKGNEIKLQTGLTIQQVSKLINCRCLIVHDDGRIYGFRGLNPHLRTKKYQRSRRISVALPASGHTTGAFTQLLQRYPDLARDLENRILGKKLNQFSLKQSREPINRLHAWFINECRKIGLEQQIEYPFNTKWQGYVSLSKYIKRLANAHPKEAVRNHLGVQEAKRLTTGDGVDQINNGNRCALLQRNQSSRQCGTTTALQMLA